MGIGDWALDIVAIDVEMTTIHVVEVKTRSTAIYGEVVYQLVVCQRT